MTRSIFDPTNPQPEQSGSTFLGPKATNNSRMPPDVIDGVVELDQTDVMEVDASGDEANGVTIDSRSEPGAVVVEGESTSNPGQEPGAADQPTIMAAPATDQSDLQRIAQAERELEQEGKVTAPDNVARSGDDLSNPGQDARP